MDTFVTGWRKCAEAARMMGLSVPSPAEFRAVYGSRPFAECVKTLHPGIDVAAFSAAYDGLAERFPARPLGQVGYALQHAAAAGLRLGVLTNGNERKTMAKLSALGLSGTDFEFVCHRDNSPVPKPDVGAFIRLESEFGVVPENSWYASDHGADWAGCARAGFHSIGVVTGKVGSRPDGEVPDLIVPNLEAAVPCMPVLADIRTATRRVPVRHVGLDAGFTLIEHHTSPARLLASALAAQGFTVREQEIDAAFSARAAARPDTSSWTSDDRISRELLRLYREMLDVLLDGRPGLRITDAARNEVCVSVITAYTSPANWRVRPGAVAALRRLRAAGLSLGVLSNWQSNLPAVLAATGVADLVDVVRASAACGAAKPDGKAFRVLSDAMGVDEPFSMVFCGDDARSDVAAALSFGCRAVLVRDTWSSAELLETMEVVTS